MDINYFHPRNRFNNLANTYIKYRPSYPVKLIQYLNKKIDLGNKNVADIGSGTGIFTKLLLENGNHVSAIEPNEDMRKEAEIYLKDYENIELINSTAENTRLESDSIDVITIAQAFHWFNTEQAINEFYRIIKKKGYIILIWNDFTTSSFKDDYQELFRKFSTEYNQINHDIYEEEINSIFFPNGVKKEIFNNSQLLDLDGFIGRIMSSSFSPKEYNEDFNFFLEESREIFRKYQKNDLIAINYDTKVYICMIDS